MQAVPGTITPQLTVISDDTTRTWFASLHDAYANLLAADLTPLGQARLAYIDCYRVLADAAARCIAAAQGTPLLLNLGGDQPSNAVIAAATGQKVLAVQTSLDEAAADTAADVADALFQQFAPQAVIVTLGRYGALARTHQGLHRATPQTAVIHHTHGAGAAFSAGVPRRRGVALRRFADRRLGRRVLIFGRRGEWRPPSAVAGRRPVPLAGDVRRAWAAYAVSEAGSGIGAGAHGGFPRFQDALLRRWWAGWSAVARGTVSRQPLRVPDNAPARTAIRPTTVGGMTAQPGSGISATADRQHADRSPSLRRTAQLIRIRPGHSAGLQNRSSQRPAVRVTRYGGDREPVLVGRRRRTIHR